MSLLFFSIGFGEAREKSQGGSVADEVFQETGTVLAKIGGRELDFVARIKTDRFVIVLPDTDLYGALVVAERARKALRDVLRETSSGETLGANVGVASIMPTPAGHAASFVKVGQRVLVSAEQRASSHLAYVDEELETHVLEPGEPLPSAPPVAEKLEVPKEEPLAEEDPDSSGFALSLATTYAPLTEVEASDSDASAGEDRNPLLDSEEAAEAEKAPAEVALAESAPAEPAEEPEEDQTIHPTWSGTGVDLDDIDWDH
jgi:diguanylate cyclase (GGDEF)-like protein